MLTLEGVRVGTRCGLCSAQQCTATAQAPLALLFSLLRSLATPGFPPHLPTPSPSLPSLLIFFLIEI